MPMRTSLRVNDLKAIAISDTETLKDIAGYVDLGLSLTQTMDRLKLIAWQPTQILSGSARQVQQEVSLDPILLNTRRDLLHRSLE